MAVFNYKTATGMPVLDYVTYRHLKSPLRTYTTLSNRQCMFESRYVSQFTADLSNRAAPNPSALRNDRASTTASSFAIRPRSRPATSSTLRQSE